MLRSKPWVSFFDSPLSVLPTSAEGSISSSPPLHSHSSHHHLSLSNCSPCFCPCPIQHTLGDYFLCDPCKIRSCHLWASNPSVVFHLIQSRSTKFFFWPSRFLIFLSISSPFPSLTSLTLPHLLSRSSTRHTLPQGPGSCWSLLWNVSQTFSCLAPSLLEASYLKFSLYTNISHPLFLLYFFSFALVSQSTNNTLNILFIELIVCPTIISVLGRQAFLSYFIYCWRCSS